MLDLVKRMHAQAVQEERKAKADAAGTAELKPTLTPRVLGSVAGDQEADSDLRRDPERQKCYRGQVEYCLHCLYLGLD